MHWKKHQNRDEKMSPPVDTLRSSTKPSTLPFNNVVIVGTGLMGTGIAQLCIDAGFNVIVVGRSVEKNEMCKAKIMAGLSRGANKKIPEDKTAQYALVEKQLKRLSFTMEMIEAVAHADLVLEAVVENLKVKQKLFHDIEKHVSSECILVTNTSSFQLRHVSDKMANGRLERFAGLHFFNPVHSMKLVEVIRAEHTDEHTDQLLHHFCTTIGKTAVSCRDTPGFIVNRLLIPFLLEAIRMAERGDASRRDVDTAMKYGAGHPMGPFELCDHIGLDTMKFVVDGWHQKYPEDERFTPSDTLDRLVEEGKLGKKTGEGFFKY